MKKKENKKQENKIPNKVFVINLNNIINVIFAIFLVSIIWNMSVAAAAGTTTKENEYVFFDLPTLGLVGTGINFKDPLYRDCVAVPTVKTDHLTRT